MKFSLDLFNIKNQLSINGYTLHDHQKIGAKWLINHEKKYNGGLLADEMGLGKTIQIISMMIANPQPITLIVCPASLVNQWKSEITKFAPIINILDDMTIIDDTKYNVYVTSYNSLHRKSRITDSKYNRIVCDEAHYFRNKKSKTFQTLNSIISEKRWVLTGTPIQNYKSDIQTLFKFLRRNGDLELLIRRHMLRRTLKSENIKLPAITYDIDYLPNHNENFAKIIQQNEYMFHLEKLLRLKQAAIIPTQTLRSMEDKYQCIQNMDELQLLKLNKIVEDAKKKEDKTIIFSYFRLEIRYLLEKLQDYMNVGFIDGTTSKEDKNEMVKSHDYDILIIQINAGGTGLNLQHYNHIYFTGPQWNPTLEQQAIARVYRIGQTKEVNIKRYINQKSIETHIQTIQKHKLELINTYINQ